MKKYIAQQRYKFKDDYDDMTDKQFYLNGVDYADSEGSTLGNLVLDMQQSYVLFLKAFDADIFKDKLEKIINSANTDGLCATLGNAITVERQENGYMITMSFVIRGSY